MKFQKKKFEEKSIYHSECYKEVTNVAKLRRLSVKMCEVETTDEKKSKQLKLMIKNLKFQLNAQDQSPVFLEKSYV